MSPYSGVIIIKLILVSEVLTLSTTGTQALHLRKHQQPCSPNASLIAWFLSSTCLKMSLKRLIWLLSFDLESGWPIWQEVASHSTFSSQFLRRHKALCHTGVRVGLPARKGTNWSSDSLACPASWLHFAAATLPLLLGVRWRMWSQTLILRC